MRFRERCDQMYFRNRCDRVHFRDRCEKDVFLHTSGHTKFVICNDSPGGIVGLLLLLLLLLFRSLPRAPTGTISSGPVQDTKNLKICPGREQSGLGIRQVPFTQTQTPTHTTGLNMTVFPMVKDRLYACKAILLVSL